MSEENLTNEELESTLEEMGVAEESAPAADVVRSASEVIERAKAALSESRTPIVGSAQAAGRDVPVSSVVHLMGIATSSQVGLLENKLDTLSTKLTSVTMKLEKVSSQLDSIQSGSSFDRIDFQLNDIKTILKKVLPYAMSTPTAEPTIDTSASSSVLTSVKVDVDEELKKAAAAEEYQRAEAERIRNEASQPQEQETVKEE